MTITPSTTDALTVVLTAGDVEVFKISSIDGTINYSGGVIKVYDGTKLIMTDYENYTSDLTVSGGDATVEYGDDGAAYSISEGGTLYCEWEDGLTW